jgi:integrase/recombinase XerD
VNCATSELIESVSYASARFNSRRLHHISIVDSVCYGRAKVLYIDRTTSGTVRGMEIDIFVRHSSDCPHVADEKYKRCNCRKWFYCSEWKPDPRRSAKTRSWTTAVANARKLEQNSADHRSIRVDNAVEDYLKDKLQQNVSDVYHQKLTSLLEDRLIPFCEEKKISRLSQLDIQALKEFRVTWSPAANALTRSKWQERLRSFLLYCKRNKWISENPAELLSRINVGDTHTDYFTPDDMAKILAAVDLYHGRGEAVELWRKKAKAFILVSRWSGLRISDVCVLTTDKIVGDSLYLYTRKNGVHVYVPLPQQVLDALNALPREHKNFYFWNGRKKVLTLKNNWWRTLNRIFAHAKLGKRSHPHMFRHTMAIELLLAGVSIEEVAAILGHSIRICEKHYAGWVKARQEKAAIAVRKSWLQ